MQRRHPLEQGARREHVPTIDFTTKIAPILAAQNCGVCHQPGGVADTPDAAQGGFPSYYDGDALEVWTNLTGDGAMITCDSSAVPAEEYRVCTNGSEVDNSKVIRAILGQGIDGQDHYQLFSSIENNDARLIRQWIFEGALFTP